MSTIKINSSAFIGKIIAIKNGKIIVDGKDVTPDSKEINITIEGDIKDLNVDSCNKISISGNVETVKTMSGDIDVTGNINGSTSTMSGDIDVSGDINGDVKTTSGNIKSNNITGSVSTISGNIKHQKNEQNIPNTLQ